MSINENCDPILPIQKPEKGKETFDKREKSSPPSPPTRTESVSSPSPKSRNSTKKPTEVKPQKEAPSRKSTTADQTPRTAETPSVPRNKPTSTTAIRRRRTSGHSVGSPPYTEDKGGFKEPPTQHGKIQGEEIEEKEDDCGCDDEEIESEEDSVRDEQKRTIYPYNKVYQTESGHVVEFDDTYGSERISVNHRTGSFVEFHPTGDVVHKVAGDLHYSVIRDSHIHVNGYSEITVDKALKIYVNAKDNENTEEKALNFDIHIGKNSNINIYVENGDLNIALNKGNANILLEEGDINLTQEKGNYNHYVNGDYNLQCTGNMHTVIGENVVNEIGGSRSTRIDGKLDHLEMTEENSYYELNVKNHTFKSKSNFIKSKEYFHEIEQIFEMRTGDNLVLDAKRNLNLVSSGNAGHISLFCNGSKGLSPSSGEIRLFTKSDIHIKTESGNGFFEFGGGQLNIFSRVRFAFFQWIGIPLGATTAKFFQIKQHEDFLILNQDPVQKILNFGFQNINIDWIFTINKNNINI